MENRSQTMQEKTVYNPRKYNLASKLSSCIQREQSIILAFPTNNSIMEIYEKRKRVVSVASILVYLLILNF